MHNNERIAEALRCFFLRLLGTYHRFVHLAAAEHPNSYRLQSSWESAAPSPGAPACKSSQPSPPPLAARGLVFDHEAFAESSIGSARTRTFLHAMRQTQVRLGIGTGQLASE